MNKLWTLDSIPSFIAAALLGSAITAYLMVSPGAPGLTLFAHPLLALGVDQLLRRTEYQASEPAVPNLFSYAPRLGVSLAILGAFGFHLWLATVPKDWTPFTFYSKLSVFVFSIGLIAIGSTMGRMRPKKIFGNPFWVNESSLAFRKKARLEGWVFVLAGLIAIPINLWDPMAAKYFLLGAVIVDVPMAYGYSYYVWKHDPDRTPVAVKS